MTALKLIINEDRNINASHFFPIKIIFKKSPQAMQINCYSQQTKQNKAKNEIP